MPNFITDDRTLFYNEKGTGKLSHKNKARVQAQRFRRLYVTRNGENPTCGPTNRLRKSYIYELEAPAFGEIRREQLTLCIRSAAPRVYSTK